MGRLPVPEILFAVGGVGQDPDGFVVLASDAGDRASKIERVDRKHARRMTGIPIGRARAAVRCQVVSGSLELVERGCSLVGTVGVYGFHALQVTEQSIAILFGWARCGLWLGVLAAR